MNHWDFTSLTSDYTVSGNPNVVVTRLWLATPRLSRWQRFQRTLRRLLHA